MPPRTTPWKRPPSAGLYLIRFSDDHYYGGRSATLDRRWRSHWELLKAGSHYNRRMQAVFNLHGRFEPEVLQEAGPGVDLRAEEQKWLDAHFRQPGCVNLSPDSDGGCEGHTEETRQKMSKTRSSRPDLRELAKKSLALGRGRAPSQKALDALRRYSDSQRGGQQPPEVVAKRAASHRGRKNTPETIEKMRAAAKLRVIEKPQRHGEETRKKISGQQRGRLWVNNGLENRRVLPEDAPQLLSSGWVRGRFSAVGSPPDPPIGSGS